MDTNRRFRGDKDLPLLYPYLKTAIIVVAAVVITIGLWYVFGVNPGRFGAEQPQPEDSAVTASADG